MAIHFLTDEQWSAFYRSLLDIAGQYDKRHPLASEASTYIRQTVQSNATCQLLYCLACLQVRALLQGDRQGYQIVTKVHDQVSDVMLQYERRCAYCDSLRATAYDQDYQRYLCQPCRLRLNGV